MFLIRLTILLLLCPLLTQAAELRKRSGSTNVQRMQERNSFGLAVLRTISKDMPTGGSYSATPEDVARVAEQAVVWSDSRQQLLISPHKAAPTFCSAACYMVMLRALQRWEQQSGYKLPPAVWQALDVKPDQSDGTGAWGRANANGPGLARLVNELKVGINFRDVRQAQPGDFLKIFWSDNIGAHERGHLVVYLGLEKKNGTTHLRYWSANKPGGYGIKSVPLSRMHNLIFTRITTPQNFVRTPALPAHDPWLSAMQSRDFSFAEVCRACNIR